MLAAVTLFDSSTLAGLLAPVLFLVAVGLGAWAYARVHISKAQEQAITTWKQNFEAQEERARLADMRAAENLARYEAERDAKHALQTELAAEKLKTDQTLVLTALADIAKLVNAQSVTLERVANVLIKNGDAKH